MNSGLNDAFEANRKAFASRFPELSGLLALDSQDRARRALESIPDTYRLEISRSGHPTLSVGGSYLHSRYDPARDAERALDDPAAFPPMGCVFAGIGLGYSCELYAARYPNSSIVVIEPDIYVFYLMLASRPLESLFAHANLMVLAGITAREAATFLDTMGLEEIPVHENAALAAPNRPWFDEFDAVRERNRQKRQINANTLKRFGGLWLRNVCANLTEMRDRAGIGCFAGALEGIPTLVVAAGPSLDRVLPHLAEIKKRAAIVAVDTAVRACVRAGVEPDFIVLVDPQYWNWRHLDGVSCATSVLITESAAWPAVFRFPCRSIHLCSSLFPLGKFIESRIGAKGELGAGGSVATTAWDFARHAGAREIYMAALDLGFPNKRTHFTGSIFEDRTHTVSGRTATAETALYNALYGAGPYPVPDYRGGTVLTDKRLVLYAWWFESRLASFPENRTRTITPEGVRIPGFAVSSVEAMLALPEIRGEIDARIERALEKGTTTGGARDGDVFIGDVFIAAVSELRESLADIASLARRASRLCRDASEAARAHDEPNLTQLTRELDALDARIIAHPAKDLAAMLIPDAERALQNGSIVAKSGDLYAAIAEAAEKNLALIEKNSLKIQTDDPIL